MRTKRLVELILAAIFAALLLIFLAWRWQLALNRYFDVDEFAHLHWALRYVQGKLPYIDFFTFFPPGFYWFLTPIFWFFNGIKVVVAARIVAFMIFIGIAAAAGCLFYLMRWSPWGAVTATAILAFLPLPADKFLEIRPDNLATLLILIGLICQIKLIRSGRKISGVLGGLFYGLSLVVLTKFLPVIMYCFIVSLFHCFKSKNNIARKQFSHLLLGFLTPLGLFGLWLVTLGNFDLVLYSLIKLPLEANQLSKLFPMSPDLFFYPNATFYGKPGWSTGLVVNHAIWIFAILVGLHRLLERLIKLGKLDKFSHGEILIAGVFFVQIILFVQFVPLKHTQYLIPIAVFVAFYAADGILMLWKKISISPISLIGLIGLVLLLYQTFTVVNQPKLSWTNTEMLGLIEKIWVKVPVGEPLLDLDGRTLYYTDPYYVCCLPWGQFTPFLSRKLPSLIEDLEQTKTKYIYEGQLGRVGTLLPEDQAYIRQHYRVSEIPGLLTRSD